MWFLGFDGFCWILDPDFGEGIFVKLYEDLPYFPTVFDPFP